MNIMKRFLRRWWKKRKKTVVLTNIRFIKTGVKKYDSQHRSDGRI